MSSTSASRPNGDSARVDTQSLSDKDAAVFETVATLEFAGQVASRSAITAATRLDPAEVAAILADLTKQGLLTVATTGDPAGDDTVYEPANRDWSTQPGRATGHQWTT